MVNEKHAFCFLEDIYQSITVYIQGQRLNLSEKENLKIYSTLLLLVYIFKSIAHF